jgi:ribonuclease P protein component
VLTAEQRLRRRRDFTDAVRSGRRAQRGFLVVHLRSGLPAPAVRAGFVIPRTVGTAVRRNLVRRRLRALIRPRLAELPIGTNVVIRAMPGAGERGFDALAGDLTAALGAALAGRAVRAASSGAAAGTPS